VGVSSKDSVNRISKGKRSARNIGSRGIPHRLTKSEREEFERAKKRGYLIRKRTHRDNIENIWWLWCQENKIPFKVICASNGKE
jgi:hypothetical protein